MSSAAIWLMFTLYLYSTDSWITGTIAATLTVIVGIGESR